MYEIDILRRAMKDIARLPDGYSRLVADRINALAHDPRPRGARKLANEPGYRLRVGVYRILYEVDDARRVVTIYRVKHRREVYRGG